MSMWVCAVAHCQNNSFNCDVSYAQNIPKNRHNKQKWLKACRITEIQLKSHMKVCRDHFHESDFTSSGRMKANIVPSKNMRRRTRNSRDKKLDDGNGKSSGNNNLDEFENEPEEPVVVLDRHHLEEEQFVYNEDQLSILSEEDNFNGFESITPVELPAISQAIIMLMNSDPFNFLGISPEATELIEIIANNTGISTIDIMLTFRKLRLDEEFPILEDYFDFSNGEAKQIFIKTVTVLAQYMQSLIVPPSKFAVFEDIPVDVRQKRCQTHFYLSHFSIVVEPTDELCTNEAMFDGSKHVIRYLYLIRQDEYISFVSEGYGGHLPPMKILPVCDSLQEIIKDESNMVDIIIEETVPNPVISEHMKKMKEFSMINNKKSLDKDFINYLDDIIVIVTALINLQTVNYKD